MTAWDKAEDERRAFELARKKSEANQRGKEPFDLVKLERLVDHIPHQRKDLEYVYYVQQPSLMTLEEFAESIRQTNRWDHG